jgi:hypothetical protein
VALLPLVVPEFRRAHLRPDGNRAPEFVASELAMLKPGTGLDVRGGGRGGINVMGIEEVGRQIHRLWLVEKRDAAPQSRNQRTGLESIRGTKNPELTRERKGFH